MAKPRDYKQEQKTATARGEDLDRAQRNKARRMMKAKGVDVAGKDVGHIKAMSQGGKTVAGNLRVETVNGNRSYPRTSTGAIKKRKKGA